MKAGELVRRGGWLLNAFGYAGRNNGSNEQYQFWQQDYHPIVLGDRDRLIQRMKYLHQNPVRAGIVSEAHYYRYSSALDYYEATDGLLPLVKVEREGLVIW